MELTAAQGRVLGALVEKERTTPQTYPLTDNALVAACNQTTSRDPVVSYDVATVRVAVRELRELGLLRTVHRSGERSDKHRHELEAALGLSPEQVALLAVLLLRGPQTLAELRSRAERLHPFATVDEVERELVVLADRDEPLVGLLPRRPGRKEARFGQLLMRTEPGSAGGEGTHAAAGAPAAWDEAAAGAVPAAVPGAGSVPAPDRTPDAAPHDVDPYLATVADPQALTGLAGTVAELADEVAALRRDVEHLRDALRAATGG